MSHNLTKEFNQSVGNQASFSAANHLPEDDEIFETYEAQKPTMRTVGL
jgi:hypothetical protein